MAGILARLLQLLLVATPIRAHWPHDVINDVAVAGDNVFVGSRRRLLHSTDGLTSLRLTRVLFQDFALETSATFEDDNLLFLFTADDKDFCYSTDLGLTLECPFKSCDFGLFGRQKFVASAAGVAITVDADLNLKRLTSGNNVTSWETVNFDVGGSECPAIAADPVTETFFLGTSDGDLYQSSDLGVTWKRRWTFVDEPVQLITAADEQILFLLTANDTVYSLDCWEVSLISPFFPDVDALGELVLADVPTPVISIAAHRVNGTVTLFVTRENSYAAYFTRDFGEIWQTKSQRDGGFIDPWGGDAYDFGDDEVTHFALVPESKEIWAATFVGLFRSQDDGETWTYKSTINAEIIGISIAKLTDGFQVAFNTYMAGDFAGKVTLSLGQQQQVGGSGVSIANDQVESVSIAHVDSGPEHNAWFEPYWGYVLSPNYETDSVSFRRGYFIKYGQAITQRIQRSTDTFESDIIDLYMPFLDESRDRTKASSYSVQDLRFSKDGTTLYACGFNIGCQTSLDYGDSWTLLLDPRPYTALHLELSPTDNNTMVLLLTNSVGLQEGNPNVLWASRDAGATWEDLQLPPRLWSDCVLTSGNVLVTTSVKNRRLFALDLDDPQATFRQLEEANYDDTKGLYGFRDSIAASPDGTELAAAFQEGDVLFGSIDKNLTFHADHFTNEPAAFFISTSVRRANWRHQQEVIAYSPNYANDRIIFGRDFNKILVSLNAGFDWQVIYQVPAAVYDGLPQNMY